MSLRLARLARPTSRPITPASYALLARRHYNPPTDPSPPASLPPPSPKKYVKYVPPEVEVFSGPSTRRNYATTSDPDNRLPRPPPSKQPDPETFSAPSKPRAYYARPERDLPPLQVCFRPSHPAPLYPTPTCYGYTTRLLPFRVAQMAVAPRPDRPRHHRMGRILLLCREPGAPLQLRYAPGHVYHSRLSRAHRRPR